MFRFTPVIMLLRRRLAQGMPITNKMRSAKTSYRLHLILSIIEGIFALAIFFRFRSMSKNALLLGYSAPRLLLAGSVMVMLLLFAGALLKSLSESQRQDKLYQRLIGWISQGDRWLVAVVTLLFLTFLGTTGLIMFPSSLFQDFPIYAEIVALSSRLFGPIAAVIDDAWTILLWWVLFAFQTSVMLFLSFPKLARDSSTYKGEAILKTLLFLSLIALSLFHWIILALQMQVLKLIPGWYWDIQAKPFSFRDAMFLILLAFTLALVAYALNHPQKIRRNLLILFALGWFIQVGFGVIEGQGFESLRQKYATSHHKSHAMKASADEISLLETIRDYENLYGSTMFQSTKPPGTMVIYILIRYVSDWIDPQPTQEGRFLALTTFEAFVFPLISFLVLFVLYRFSRTLLPEEHQLLPSILYILLPNVILLALFLDQVLYPVLFVSGAYLVVHTVEKRAFSMAILSGALIYLFAFFTFSMLPLVPFAAACIGIDFLANRRERKVLSSLSLFLGILMGIALLSAVFYYALDYNIVERYQGAMQVVRNFDFLLRVDTPGGEELPNTGFLLQPRYILSALYLNNMEFASAVGFPIYLLFIVQGVRTLAAFIRKKATMRDGILASFFVTFLAMNVFAPIQGEAARLWIFWAPMVVLFAALGLATIFRREKGVIYLIVVLQLVTIYLTYKFQDLAP
jgi:hypothetical protein